MTTIRVKLDDSYTHVMNLYVAGTNTPVDLTAATGMILVLTDIDTGLVAATVNCTITSVPLAEISFVISPPVTSTRAMYIADFKLLGTGGTIMTIPTLAQQGLWVY